MNGVEDKFYDKSASLLNIQLDSKTPLPWLQIAIMLLLHTCEPISSQSIYPYVNEVFTLCSNCCAPSC